MTHLWRHGAFVHCEASLTSWRICSLWCIFGVMMYLSYIAMVNINYFGVQIRITGGPSRWYNTELLEYKNQVNRSNSFWVTLPDRQADPNTVPLNSPPWTRELLILYYLSLQLKVHSNYTNDEMEVLVTHVSPPQLELSVRPRSQQVSSVATN